MGHKNFIYFLSVISCSMQCFLVFIDVELGGSVYAIRIKTRKKKTLDKIQCKTSVNWLSCLISFLLKGKIASEWHVLFDILLLKMEKVMEMSQSVEFGIYIIIIITPHRLYPIHNIRIHTCNNIKITIAYPFQYGVLV